MHAADMVSALEALREGPSLHSKIQMKKENHKICPHFYLYFENAGLINFYEQSLESYGVTRENIIKANHHYTNYAN